MWPFHTLKSVEGDEIPKLKLPSPARSYVNEMLMALINRGRLAIVIREGEALPPVKTIDAGKMPSFRQVFNRLKVMTNLNPVFYGDPVKGSFGLTKHGIANEDNSFVVEAVFVETRSEVSVSIQLTPARAPEDWAYRKAAISLKDFRRELGL